MAGRTPPPPLHGWSSTYCIIICRPGLWSCAGGAPAKATHPPPPAPFPYPAFLLPCKHALHLRRSTETGASTLKLNFCLVSVRLFFFFFLFSVRDRIGLLAVGCPALLSCQRGGRTAARAVDVHIGRGEGTFHSAFTLHRSDPNTSMRRRCAWIVRYVPTGTTMIGGSRDTFPSDYPFVPVAGKGATGRCPNPTPGAAMYGPCFGANKASKV